MTDIIDLNSFLTFYWFTEVNSFLTFYWFTEVNSFLTFYWFTEVTDMLVFAIYYRFTDMASVIVCLMLLIFKIYLYYWFILLTCVTDVSNILISITLLTLTCQYYGIVLIYCYYLLTDDIDLLIALITDLTDNNYVTDIVTIILFSYY